MEEICDKDVCMGCWACCNICSKNAISIIEDKFGFLHPQINHNLCIDCGACRTVCPNNTLPIFHIEMSTYAAVSKNDDIYKKSTSGGVATTLSTFIIEKGGVVYGAAFDNAFNLLHSRIDSVKELHKIQGTKYVQSSIGYSYKQIKNDLKSKTVLFIGTPCQVAGLLNYIPNSLHKNLFTVSFICGGVPSNKFLKQNLNSYLKDAKNIKFRNGCDYGFWIEYTNNKIIHLQRFYNQYFRAFDNKISLRSSCYGCKFSRRERIGDITIGDFWGLSSGNLLDREKSGLGVSIILCSSEKGVSLIKNSSSNFIIEKHDISETFKFNPRLLSPVIKNDYVKKFRQSFEKNEDFDKSVGKILNIKYKIYEIKGFLKKNKILSSINDSIKSVRK